MRKSDEIRRDEELADRLRPTIVQALRNGDEPLDISARLSTEHDLDDKKAYRWVFYTAESFEKRRKGIQALGLTLLWGGVIGAVATGAVSIFTPGSSAWIVGVVSGIPVAVVGATVSLRSRKLVRRVS